MAGKSNFADIQRQDRKKTLRTIGMIGIILLLCIGGAFFVHYFMPSKKKNITTTNQTNASLTMVPTTINYYDPQSEKSYDIGTSYIILSDGSNGYMKVDADGSVTKVSSDGTYLGTATEAERNKMLEAALKITQKDNQADMALAGLKAAVDAETKAKEDAKEENAPLTGVDLLYSEVEKLGYNKEDFIRKTYLAGASPKDAATLLDLGGDPQSIIKAIMSKEVKADENKENKGLTIEMQRVGIDEPVTTTASTDNSGYPSWMKEVDPTAGMDAVLSSLAGISNSSGTTDSWSNVNKQDQKKSWEAEQQTREISSTKLTRYDLVAGTVVPITIVTGVNTDLPGSIVGIVRQDVYDTLTGTNVLIPKGSRLLASYNSSVSFGQKSVQIAWSQLIIPDGYQFTLPGFSGITPDGYSGVKGKYNGHFWQLLGGALLGSMIDWGATYATTTLGKTVGGGTLGELANALAGSMVNTTSTVGQQYAQMWANLQPTIKIKTGTETQLLVNATITLKRN